MNSQKPAQAGQNPLSAAAERVIDAGRKFFGHDNPAGFPPDELTNPDHYGVGGASSGYGEPLDVVRHGCL